jgi:chorismate synthase
MPSNAFGDVVRLTTFGESHGPAIGGVIDGFPAGFPIDGGQVQQALERRRPGRSAWVSPRQEPDQIEWLSGLLEGVTTGAPIAFILRNRDARPSAYQELNTLWRPGHAQWSYHQKYGLVDGSGGGRSSARETAVRVAAGNLAQQWLARHGIVVGAEIAQIGNLVTPEPVWSFSGVQQRAEASERQHRIDSSAVFTSDEQAAQRICTLLEQLQQEGDSIGAIVRGWVVGMPPGLGDPLAAKLEAELAHACLSLPASKAFAIGEGFEVATQRGSVFNDLFQPDGEGGVRCSSNRAGGLLGGISTGQPLLFQVGFKPTSSIAQAQTTCTREGVPCTMRIGPEGRHDPCVGIRAVPVVTAVAAWAVFNAALRQRLARSESYGTLATMAAEDRQRAGGLSAHQ